jgi:hypothetical protein
VRALRLLLQTFVQAAQMRSEHQVGRVSRFLGVFVEIQT